MFHFVHKSEKLLLDIEFWNKRKSKQVLLTSNFANGKYTKIGKVCVNNSIFCLKYIAILCDGELLYCSEDPDVERYEAVTQIKEQPEPMNE